MQRALLRAVPAEDAADGETVGESAYRRIRFDVLNGRLPPGAKLKLEQLRTTYNVGLGTLREILNRLVSEKLVVAEGQRGFEVAPVSASNLREVAELRLLIEREGLRRSFAQGDAGWEARVTAAYDALARLETTTSAHRAADTELWIQRDRAFHCALVSASGSRTLITAHGAVCERYMRYQVLALRIRDDITANEHREFVAAALRRDAAAAEELIARHIARGIEQALQTGFAM